MLIIEILYLISTALLAVYGLNSLLLTWLARQRGVPKTSKTSPTGESLPACVGDYPHVTVQLPIYNERYVAERLIDAVVNLDWPAERLQIQVLDDSTDETRHLIAAALARLKASGANVELDHRHRTDRQGYKAGAMQAGLALASGEFIAIFDADFVPPSDFLKRTIPYFNDPRVGCVQTRWGHLNPDSSQLTRVQALGIDGHFLIEQQARHTVGAFLNFNGTAGVWRRACITDAGGWQGDTLTEDLDLSYRAQLRGWRISYRPEIVTPAELPVQIDAFKRQQFRWAKGSFQTALKLMGSLWRSPQPLWLKIMATLHLTTYGVHPLMLLNLLLTLPMTMSDSFIVQLTPLFTIGAIGPPLLYWTAMQAEGATWPARVVRLFLLIGLGTGLAVNNTRAIWQAVSGAGSEFKRTPKFALVGQSGKWQTSAYTLPREATAWFEVGLAIYALALLGWVISQGVWWLVFWMMLYALGYSYVAILAFVQTWQTRLARLKLRLELDW